MSDQPQRPRVELVERNIRINFTDVLGLGRALDNGGLVILIVAVVWLSLYYGAC